MKAFKSTVRRFMLKNNHPNVVTVKEDFEIFMEGRMTWDVYWSSKNLLRKEFWADKVFLRATAWFLQLDIVLHQNVPGCPKKTISGNIDDETSPCNGPKLHLGYLMDRHYQSIIPRVQPVMQISEDTDTSQDTSQDNSQPRVQPVVQKLQDADTSQDTSQIEKLPDICPACRKTCKNVLLHIDKAKKCKERVTMEEIDSLKQISEERTKEKKKKRKAAEMEKDPEKVREANRKWKAAQKERDPEKMKENDRKRKADQMEKDPEKVKEYKKKWDEAQKEKDIEKVREEERKRKAELRAKDKEKTKQDDRRYQQRHRAVQN